jgi:fucose permease
VRGLPAAQATLIAGAVVAGGLAASAILAGAPAPAGARVRAAGAWLAAAGAAGLVLGPGVPVQALAAFALGFGVDGCWLEIQAATLRVRPGQTGTVDAVVSVIVLVGAGAPVLAGGVADTAGLGAALWCYVAATAVLAVAIGLRGALSGRERHAP